MLLRVVHFLAEKTIFSLKKFNETFCFINQKRNVLKRGKWKIIRIFVTIKIIVNCWRKVINVLNDLFRLPYSQIKFYEENDKGPFLLDMISTFFFLSTVKICEMRKTQILHIKIDLRFTHNHSEWKTFIFINELQIL